MYVCHCKAVTDRTIDRVIREGACTTRDVGRACGAGTECGSCLPELRRRLSAARQEQTTIGLPREMAAK